MADPAKTILLVDDEEDLVYALTARLKNRGFKVVVAREGLGALRQARSQNPDLIILDIMLPKMDGYKVCRLLKSDKRYSPIPILMLSARGQERDRELGKKAGADDYLVKPFNSEDLISRIEKLMKKNIKQR